MQNTILFKEQQRFIQIWLWVLLIAINLFFISQTISKFLVGRLNGDNPVLPTSTILTMICIIGFTLLLASFKLHTEIKEDGIYIRFFPLFITKKYSWNAITNCYIRKYKPLIEYGGWGIRVGIFFGKGMAYSTSGNHGIQLVFNNGKRVLIGTHEPDKAKKILQQLEKYKE